MLVLHRFTAFALALTMVGLSAAPAWGDDDSSTTTTTTTTTSKKAACKAGQKMTKTGCVSTTFRGLASLAPTAEPVGQGNQMLNDVKSTNPKFLRQGNKGDSNVQLTGVCRGSDGSVVYSGQKGYSQCLDSLTTNSGNTSDYFSAYRQAGVGIQVK